MYKFIRFNFDLLNKERIATLRVIGKKIGVKSPTSKNKEVLIEEIIAIQTNEKEPIIITEDELRKTKIKLNLRPRYIISNREGKFMINLKLNCYINNNFYSRNLSKLIAFVRFIWYNIFY